MSLAEQVELNGRLIEITLAAKRRLEEENADLRRRLVRAEEAIEDLGGSRR